jgi:uncharacterized protein (UPF0305 family)
MYKDSITIFSMPEDSMIKIRNTRVYDLGLSIRASKFPMTIKPDEADDSIKETQKKLAQSEPGSGHDNYLQGIRVAFDMDISVKALVEAERYHFFDIVSCTSTMHRIVRFDMNDCYNKYVDNRMIGIMIELIEEYNDISEEYHNNPTSDNKERMEDQYLRILYSNPCGFTYTARFTTNYRQLKTIYNQRKNHRLPEWQEFCKWIEEYLPHSYLITGDDGGDAA